MKGMIICIYPINSRDLRYSLTIALSIYEARIKLQADLFISKLSHGRGFNITEWSMLFAFDTMGEIAFGKNFGCLEREAEHPMIHGIRKHMETIGTISQVPWLIYLISRIPGATAEYSGFFRSCETEIESKLQASTKSG